MKRIWLLGWVLALGLLAACGNAATPAAPISVTEAWVRASPMMDKAAAAYMVITNAQGSPERLLSVQSTAATTVELHVSKEVDGMMSMQPVAAIDIPAMGQAELKPGGYHVMLIGLTQELKVGETLTLTLTFENAGEVVVVAPIRADE